MKLISSAITDDFQFSLKEIWDAQYQSANNNDTTIWYQELEPAAGWSAWQTMQISKKKL